MKYAKTNEGQLIYGLLVEHSMTPNTFRNMDPRDTAFLIYAHTEKNRRQAEHQADMSRKARLR